MPPQLAPVEVLGDVVGSEQLHTHDGEDEDDDGEDETEIAERSHRSADDTDEQVERRPGLGKFEHAQLKNTLNSVTESKH